MPPCLFLGRKGRREPSFDKSQLRRTRCTKCCDERNEPRKEKDAGVKTLSTEGANRRDSYFDTYGGTNSCDSGQCVDLLRLILFQSYLTPSTSVTSTKSLSFGLNFTMGTQASSAPFSPFLWTMLKSEKGEYLSIAGVSRWRSDSKAWNWKYFESALSS